MEKIKFNVIDIVAIFLFHACCIRLYYVPNSMYISMVCELISLIYLIPKIKIITKRKYRRVNICLMLFICIGMISSFLSKSNIEDSLWFYLKIFTIFFFCEYAHEKKKIKNILKIFSFLFLFYALLSMFVDLNYHYLFAKYNRNYLIGNKFSISYAAFLSLILFDTYRVNFLKKQIRMKIFVFIVFIFSIYVSYFTDCNTGIICCILYYILSKIDIERLKSGIVAISTSIIASVLLILFRNFLLNKRIIQYLITELLHRSLDLSGRIQIYENIFSVIFEKPFIGHGYGNSYEVLYNRINAPNTQNALLEWWFNSGIIGVCLLLVLIFYIFNNLHKNEKQYVNVNNIVIGIFVFLILGSIEITIGTSFFLLLALLNFGYEKEKENG